MDASQTDRNEIVLAVRRSIEQALAEPSDAPLLKAAELLAEALAKDPSLASMLDAWALEELLAALGLPASETSVRSTPGLRHEPKMMKHGT